MARREHPRYENMEWPDWEYIEFPMMIYPGAADPRVPEYHINKKGRRVMTYPGVIVHSDEELDGVLKGEIELDAVTGEILTEEDTRKALIRECEIQGLLVDKRWGIPKLQAALDEAAKGPEEIT